MRSLQDLFLKKEPASARELDEKTIFFLFQEMVKKKYGERGLATIQPAFYRDGVLGIRTKNPLWSNELWLARGELVQALNAEIGEGSVQDLKLLH